MGHFIHTRIGSYDLSMCRAHIEQEYWQIDDNDDDLIPLGYLSSVEDCVVPLNDANPNSGINRDISVWQDDGIMRTLCPMKLLVRPSEAIESAHKSAIVKLRSSTNGKSIPLSTVGVHWCTSTGKSIVTYNPTSHITFNWYNSQVVNFEVHRNMDLLMLMTAFLKHNGVWGGSTALMSLSRFDYVGAYFDPSWGGPSSLTSSVYDFDKEQMQFAAAYKICERDVYEAAWDSNKKKFKRMAATGNDDATPGCSHTCPDLHVELDKGIQACVACFCNFFFTEPFQVKPKPGGANAARAMIDGWLSRGAVEEDGGGSAPCSSTITVGLVDVVRKTLGKLVDGRSWNWPEKMDANMRYEWVTHTLARCLDKPSVDPSLLYSLMNPFGKMLLLFLENGGTPSPPKNKTVLVCGRFFDVVIPIGNCVWSFQMCPGKTVAVRAGEGGCLETRRQLPFDASDDECPKRRVYKAFCRGEGITKAGEVLSDVAQSTSALQLLLNNREFDVDASGHITSRAILTDNIVSLEATGYRSVRAPGTKNQSRVSGRILQLLKTRVGGNMWYSKLLDAILVEDLSTSPELSTQATIRAATDNRVFYYDIETTGLNPLDRNALVTAVCGTLTTGGVVERAERAVFGLATDTGTPDQLELAVRKCYDDDNNDDDDEKKKHVTETLPDRVHTYASEIEMLVGWGDYLREKARPHIISGWNSFGFDDFYIFATIVRYLVEKPWGDASHNPLRTSNVQQRLLLARGGMYDFSAFVNPTTGYLFPSVATTLSGMIREHAGAALTFGGRRGGVGEDLQQSLMGSMATCLRLDMMKVCAKAYREQLSEFNLNAMMKKVSKDGNKEEVLKDPIDVKYHLLKYVERTPDEQATVLRYCSKDAHLVAIVSSEISKEGEIFQLAQESGLSVATVVTHLDRPLCIIEGALYRCLGTKRADMRGCGIRRHSLATDTKGGMVAQPLVEQTPCQTVDLSSLYPSLMHDFNLCTTTYATHGQMVELRNRRVRTRMREAGLDRPNLAIMDEANTEVLARYQCVDIVVPSWVVKRPTGENNKTRLEKELDFSWWRQSLQREDWSSDNRSPNALLRCGGLDYAPEVPCNDKIQMAAYSGDDVHIQPTGLEYLVTVLPVLAWESPRLAAHVTAGECTDAKQLWAKMEQDFSVEEDERLQQTRGDAAFVGGWGPEDRGISNPVARRLEDYMVDRHHHRLVALCERINRRVNAFDSADDEAVKRWAARMFNVGTYCRTWNAHKDVLPGVVPTMQLRYRAQRVEMKKLVKQYRTTDPILADRNDVGEKVLKIFMNSLYGVLALRSSTKTEVQESTWREAMSYEQIMRANAAGGVGGGTRHTPMANQITQLARRVFANIGASLRQFLPNMKQAYGDTDSTFLVHNIPGDGNEIVVSGDGRHYLLVDLHLKMKLAKLIPAIINRATKGIAHGHMMNIEHERTALMCHLFAKKTYHMLHLSEGSPACKALVEGIVRANDKTMTTNDDPLAGNVGNIKSFVKIVTAPSSANGYVVPHNPGLILKLVKRFFDDFDDKFSLGQWLTSSQKWVAFDLEALRDLYTSKMLDATEWVSAKTARTISDPEQEERVAAAEKLLSLYRKGAFVKKGIISATKLKKLQSVFDRADALAFDHLLPSYEETMKEHARNCASFQVNPVLVVSSARVHTVSAGHQRNPNPAAMAINNHLNPSNKIDVDEKFLCVTAVSGWGLTLDQVPPGYYISTSVRWNPEKMIGLVAGHSVRSLSVVANTIKSVYDMVKADKIDLSSMFNTTLSVLEKMKAKGITVFPGSMSFATGIMVTDVLAHSIKSIASSDGEHAIAFTTMLEFDDDYDTKGEGEGRGEEKKTESCPLVNPDLYNVYNQLDPRVKLQHINIWNQLQAAKAIVEKKRGQGSRLDTLVANVEIEPVQLFRRIVERMKSHEKQCPLSIANDDETVLMANIIKALGGVMKCTATCVRACCQALDFVAGYCVTLQMENKRRERGGASIVRQFFSYDAALQKLAIDRISACKEGQLVARIFESRYLRGANAVIHLFELPPSGMTTDQVVQAIRHETSPFRMNVATGTGAIWNDKSEDFFGPLQSVEDWARRTAESGVQQPLPFFTGVYHVDILEIVVSVLSLMW